MNRPFSEFALALRQPPSVALECATTHALAEFFPVRGHYYCSQTDFKKVPTRGSSLNASFEGIVNWLLTGEYKPSTQAHYRTHRQVQHPAVLASLDREVAFLQQLCDVLTSSGQSYRDFRDAAKDRLRAMLAIPEICNLSVRLPRGYALTAKTSFSVQEGRDTRSNVMLGLPILAGDPFKLVLPGCDGREAIERPTFQAVVAQLNAKNSPQVFEAVSLLGI